MKQSEDNTKQKVMRLFESKSDNSEPTDKPRKIREDFEYKDVEWKSGKDTKSSIRKYLEKSADVRIKINADHIYFM